MINLLLEDSSNVQNESVDYGYTNKEKSLKNRSFWLDARSPIVFFYLDFTS